MACLIGSHDIGAGSALPALFDQVRQRFIDQRLKLPPLALGKAAQGGQNSRIQWSMPAHLNLIANRVLGEELA